MISATIKIKSPAKILNKAGKERRAVGKILNLASTYGMSGSTAGARLNKTKEEGQQLLDNFFSGFPKVKQAIEDSKVFLKANGYVEDFVGRRRRLPEINMDPYTAKFKDTSAEEKLFNPFINCENAQSTTSAEYIWGMILAGEIILTNLWKLTKDPNIEVKNEISNKAFTNYKLIASEPEKYLKELVNPEKKASAYNRTNKEKLLSDMQELKGVLTSGQYKGQPVPDNAELTKIIKAYLGKYGTAVCTDIPADPVELSAWTGTIAKAGRQCFNARIQGSAATLTKIAMVKIAKDAILNDCQAKLIIPVHDELLMECPAYYADIVEKRLPEVMISAAADVGDDIPQSCDPVSVTHWFADEYAAVILEEYTKLEKTGVSAVEAKKIICQNHLELPEKAILDVIEGRADQLEF